MPYHPHYPFYPGVPGLVLEQLPHISLQKEKAKMLNSLEYWQATQGFSEGYLRAKTTLLLSMGKEDISLGLLVDALRGDFYVVDWVWALLGETMQELDSEYAIASYARAWLMEVRGIPEQPQQHLVRLLRHRGDVRYSGSHLRAFAQEVEGLADLVLADYCAGEMAA